MSGEAASSAPPSAGKGRILLVDDEPALRRAYARILEGAGYAVVQAADGQQAAEAVARERYEAIVTDISMPGLSGLQLLRAVRDLNLEVPVLLMTGDPTVASAIDAVEYGALRYLVKPISATDLLEAVERATKLSRIASVKRQSVAYLASLDAAASDRTTLAANLQAAIDSIRMVYQPIVNWNTKRIVAFEALVRTDEPTLPHPGALFTLAEQLDSVPEVSRAIRSSIARTLSETPCSVDLFVNLHPSDLLDEALYSPHDSLAAFAKQIVLEVTERSALEESAGISARASQLRKLGYRIAIDDLGAGYAGLSYFVQLTPEVVKVDMSLVRNIHEVKIKQKLVGSLITLCRDLGMLVVVEGVETEEERAAVVDLGGELLQGYLFARPGKPFPEVCW